MKHTLRREYVPPCRAERWRAEHDPGKKPFFRVGLNFEECLNVEAARIAMGRGMVRIQSVELAVTMLCPCSVTCRHDVLRLWPCEDKRAMTTRATFSYFYLGLSIARIQLNSRFYASMLSSKIQPSYRPTKAGRVRRLYPEVEIL